MDKFEINAKNKFKEKKYFLIVVTIFIKNVIFKCFLMEI